jgi:hypothetical protein
LGKCQNQEKGGRTLGGWIAQWEESTHQMTATLVLDENYEVVDILGKYDLKKKSKD